MDYLLQYSISNCKPRPAERLSAMEECGAAFSHICKVLNNYSVVVKSTHTTTGNRFVKIFLNTLFSCSTFQNIVGPIYLRMVPDMIAFKTSSGHLHRWSSMVVLGFSSLTQKVTSQCPWIVRSASGAVCTWEGWDLKPALRTAVCAQ